MKLYKKVVLRMFVLMSLMVGLTACGGKSASDYYNEGIRLMEEKDFESAMQQFTQAIAKNPDRAEYYIDYGFALLESGKADDALIQFDKAYSEKDNQIVRENNKMVLRAKGIAYLALNQYIDAMEVLEKANAIAEKKELNRDILSYLGLACRKAGDFK